MKERPKKTLWQEFKKNPSLYIGLFLVFVLLLMAFFPSLFTSLSPTDIVAEAKLSPPSKEHRAFELLASKQEKGRQTGGDRGRPAESGRGDQGMRVRPTVQICHPALLPAGTPDAERGERPQLPLPF